MERISNQEVTVQALRCLRWQGFLLSNLLRVVLMFALHDTILRRPLRLLYTTLRASRPKPADSLAHVQIESDELGLAIDGLLLL